MSKEIVYENPSELQKFGNSQLGVTCAITGERISHESGVIYARNVDEARNGFGICQAAYDALLGVSEPELEQDSEPELEQDSGDDDKSKSKTTTPPVKPVEIKTNKIDKSDDKPEL